ncbi:MAG: LytR C-terminal domain-containing protein [Patescibacteria group bacterium]
MEETTFSYASPPPKRNKILPNIIAISVLLIAIVGSYLILNKPKKTEEKKEIVAEKNKPSPTEKPKIEKSTVKIQVINGTGTPGQAGIVVKVLVDAGYVADNIKTGNAEKFDNPTTSITAKDNYEEIITNIKDSLKSTFEKITVVSPNLDKDSEFDIVVVTGGKIFETVTPTASITSSVSPTPSLTTTPTSTPTLTPTPTP